jgi:predicted CoA-binding protein
MNYIEFENIKVWAVVGSVHNKEKFAYKIYKFLVGKGYTVYPVDPSGNNADEVKTYVSLNELPEIPEALNMVINPVRGLSFLDEAKRLNINYIWFQPGADNEEIISKAKSNGMEVIFNKCVMVEFK